MCKNCIFSEIKNDEYVFCKNIEKCVICTDKCKRFIKDSINLKEN
ncbi:hypothetical protein [Clostridium hominis]|nr:hypothetical protein [Clostridium hominis]MDU2672340.1 hypothetical protein [Clostridium sp.]